jgi:hypothetical protein
MLDTVIVSLILYVNFGSILLLPQRCSLIVNGNTCELSPSFIVSINAKNDQYMIGVVCEDHMKQMKKRLEFMQSAGRVPNGSIQFQPIKIVSTDCIRGTDEDRMEVESKRKNNDT